MTNLQNAGGTVTISFGGAFGTDPAVAAHTYYNYLVSTGESAAQAQTDAITKLQTEYQSVITTFGVTHLDFDIEGSTAVDDTFANHLRDVAIKNLETANASLRVSYTLQVEPATANDNPKGLADDVKAILDAAAADGTKIDVVNLMTMDFDDEWASTTDMATKAESAATYVHDHQLPAGLVGNTGAAPLIGVTPMIGVNDDRQETFTIDNARTLETWAANTSWVAGIGMWEMARDHAAPAGSDETAPPTPQNYGGPQATDSGLTPDQYTAAGVSNSDYAFANIFKQIAAGTTPPPPTGQTFIGDSTNQTFTGTAAGNDTVDYSQHATGAVTVDLAITTAQNPGGGQGTDTLISIENLIGTSFADHLYGNANVNVLTGGGDNDTLDGRGGADTMIGGAGNDVYYVDNLHDVVTEAVGGGTTDKVYSSVSYTLDPNTEVEYLYAHYSGTTGITLTGNQYSHHIYGGAGNDILNGGAGNDIINGEGGIDTMAGGNGNDIYYVDNAKDVVIENGGTSSGTVDKVIASVDYTLTDNTSTQVEYLYAASAGITVTGNSYSHHIYASAAGNDTLQGGSGADELFDEGGAANTMTGGAGNDLYFVSNSSDVVNEAVASTGGADRVYASVDYTLTAGSGIEKLYANDGAHGLVLGGNDLNNAIYGGAGNDTIIGGGGRDLLTGGGGDDVFKFNAVSDSTPTGGAYDTIEDFVQGHDKIDLTAIDAITGNANAHDAFNFIGSAAFAHAGDLRAVINTAGTATVLMGDTNGDGHVDFQVTLLGAIHLTTNDFVPHI